MMKKALPLLLICTLTACAGSRLPHTPGQPNESDIQEESIRYPAPDAQTQINQLGIQVSRLEQQVQILQTRVRQLERRSSRPASRTAPSSGSSISAAEAAQSQQVQQNAVETLQRAQSQYRSGHFAAAAATLKQAESGGDGSDTARKSMFLLMQSHQHLKNCESVINIGNRLAIRYRNSSEAPEALFNIGQCQYNMQQRDIAKTTWRKLVQTYPDSPAAKRALKQLNQ
ncbi:MAG: tetratricopeptide repeat protein [Neisseria sp.]|uniref:tetratricopeptide repeat protein n=1 Tax=Neisseria sp. TaxID=192066 RepID=UPI0026DC6772|nr:tetratricopeptide repeat protein [Neisseria sp.]MDO4641190.1 tetratricopeptide repeat protein [Neisseria sp.]